MADIAYRSGISRGRVRLGLIVLLLGFLLFVLGAGPGVFGIDRSEVTGFLQISVFLVGLAVLCMGGYITLSALWNGNEKTIVADIGLRLVSTGYVVAVASGMADVFGIGSHPFPAIPYFGPLQATGVMIGEGIIIIGFLMLIHFPKAKKIE